MHFYDSPLIQQKARQHLESDAYRWLQAQGYNHVNVEIKREHIAPDHGVLAALRVTVSQYGSHVLLDTRLFELRLSVSNSCLMPNNLEVAA